jgi:hypothetical protein
MRSVNPIGMRLMSRRKPFEASKCPLCQDRGRYRKYWKRGGQWCSEWVYCAHAKTTKCELCGGVVFEGFCDTCGSEYVDGKRVPDEYDARFTKDEER